jgi:hypothetical protein
MLSECISPKKHLGADYTGVDVADVADFTKDACVVCEEDFYLISWTDIFFIFIVITTALSSIVVQHF